MTSERRVVAWSAALAGLTALRLLVAALAPLSPDECYYWVWSRALAPGYVDHPPMVALWIRAGTALAGEGVLGVRLLGPLAAAAGSILLADAAIGLGLGPAAGLVAAAMLNATLVMAAGAVLMTPDTPLLFFWTATLWAACRLLATGQPVWWLAVGALAGLALDSKYTAAFLGLGLALWLAWFSVRPSPALPRRIALATPWPWAGGLVAAALFAPILIWNAAHGWASFARQGGRAGVWDPARAAKYVGELLGGQLGLATPILLVVFVAGVGFAARRAWVARDAGMALLAALTLPAALVFLQHAFGDRVQANWPAILYPSAALAAAALPGPAWAAARRFGIALGAALSAVIYVQASLHPVALSPHVDPTMRQLAGWPGFAARVAEAAEDTGARFIATDEYGVAAELARALPDIPVIGVDPRWSLFRLPRPDIAGADGLLVRSARRDDRPDPAPWATLAPEGETARGRNGIIAERFRLYRVTGRSTPGPGLALMPSPPG